MTNLHLCSIANYLEYTSIWSEEGSGKKPAEDIGRIKREQLYGSGMPVAMTHMVTMILLPFEQEAPQRVSGDKTVMSFARAVQGIPRYGT